MCKNCSYSSNSFLYMYLCEVGMCRLSPVSSFSSLRVQLPEGRSSWVFLCWSSASTTVSLMRAVRWDCQVWWKTLTIRLAWPSIVGCSCLWCRVEKSWWPSVLSSSLWTAPFGLGTSEQGDDAAYEKIRHSHSIESPQQSVGDLEPDQVS